MLEDKTCNHCFMDKPLEDFSRNERGLGGRRSVCKECTSEFKRSDDSKTRWYEAGRDTGFRATGQEAYNYPDELEYLKQDFIYNR